VEVVVLNVLAEVRSVSLYRKLKIDCVRFSRVKRSSNYIKDLKIFWELKSPPIPAQLSHRLDFELTMVSWHPVLDDASNLKKPYGVLPIEQFLTYPNGFSRKGKLYEGTISASKSP